MDQIKIGRFVAERRRSAGLTQLQLAEKLGVTDRAVSKWENGRSMPDSSVMLDLCNELGITVNDLLSGEVVTVDNYNKEIESKLLEMVKQKEESDKRLLMLEWVIGILSCVLIFVPAAIVAYFPMEEWQQFAVILPGLIPGVVGLCFAMRIEQVAGYYECKHCKHRYVPTLKAVWFAMHMGRTRYMKCPHCGKKSWQKKVISKENNN